MTINYTNLLGLAKPVTGTETGQWGDVVNDQITELVEDAVANASSISVTSGDVTLTTTTGSANQARMSTLIITGSPGVTRNVIAPSQAKTYVVINQSNASVVIKGAATTGVTLLASEKASVAWNGSDFVKIATQSGNGSFVDLTVSGSMTLSGGTANGVLYLNGSKVATSGGALTFDGSALTLGGATPRLLSNMSGTLSSRFIIQNSTTNGNSRIYLYPNGTGNISAVNGTNNSDINAADYQSFDLAVIGTTDVRLSSSASGAAAFLPLTFYTNNTEQMRLTSTGLGIGTTSPSDILTLAGGASGSYGLTINNAKVGGGTKAIFQYDATNQIALVGGNTTNGLAFQTLTSGSLTTKAVIDASGNLGIGVTPTNVASYTNLEVRGSTGGLFYTSNSNGSVKGYFGNTASVVFLNAITNHPLTFGTNDTERARITSDGNFLVGTTTSNTKFVVGATTQTGAESSVYTSATSGGDSSRFSFWRNYTVGSSSPFRAAYISNINIDDSFNSNNNQCIGFFTKSGTSEPAERARITGGGNLLVGTTTDLSSSYAYQVGSARSGGFYSEAGGTGDAGFASVSNAILYHFYCASTTQSKFYVENDGDAFNRNGTYGTISDIKHKQDVIDAPSQWDDLKAIRFRKYRMKSDVQTNPDAPYLLGVVAQELEQVSPGLVSEDPDFETKEVTDEDGNVTTKKVQVGITKTVKSSILLMKAAVALQEAMTRIEQLEAKVAALESKGV